MAKDHLGNDINVGDTVVYPVRQGSNMELKRRKVSQVHDTARPEISVYNPTTADQRSHRVKNLSDVVVVTKLLAEEPAKAA